MADRDSARRRQRKLASYHRRVAERRERGLCVKCGKCPPAPQRSICVSCNEKARAAERARADRLRAEGKPVRDPEATRRADRERDRYVFERRAKILSDALPEREYLVGSAFSGADILIGHSCFMATVVGLPIGDYPVLEAYYQRLQQRPAYQRAYPA